MEASTIRVSATLCFGWAAAKPELHRGGPQDTARRPWRPRRPRRPRRSWRPWRPWRPRLPWHPRRPRRPWRPRRPRRPLERAAVHLLVKANVAEEEVEEEEAEDDALLTDKKKRKRKPQAKKKSKPQSAGSAAHEADAAVGEDRFAYSAISLPYDMVSSNGEWFPSRRQGSSRRR